jgi:RNA polymerase-binding transcription factor DksA/uncharacterized protein YdcH (DUF465 family)
MTVEHHYLVSEFPHLKTKIHQLKTENAHFRKLLDEYHELTTEIEKMENEVMPVSTQTEEEQKIHRVYLKDELYRMLTTEA